ncbi:hypothetical protein JOF56_003226 [Kibdelosporangium banguiense]|uniref:Uncharacterized protein n=1 Tax=Kibdelosporangium banguiense TaxID=1365924 RepID=A0ABS4TG82_9PSEU|nr:hypothetical protein [Kibdelosporangium banguiense]MBP2322841.1 hypothetical protein [Kibdelosporangium banguiense]
MDPRERADAALARARARGAFVVTPEDAISPMDAVNTLQIPRVVVDALDNQHQADPEATMAVGHPLSDPQPTQRHPSPRRPQPYPNAPKQHHYQHQAPPPRQAPPPEQEQQQQEQPEGMVPTVKKQPSPRPTMSQRLDGKL